VKLRPGELPSPEGLEEADTAVQDERVVRCAACGGRVTKDASRITMGGSHEHAFMNPSAMRFVVQCFADAPGCAPEGERSTVWTWFPGYAWQSELCRSCGVHLGWSFHGAGGAFYGLVKDRLAS
jgi:hypothetical protein